MRSSVLWAVAGALLLTSGLRLSGAFDGEELKLELKSFKFKVPDGQANLFGHNEDDGKLFFYSNGTAESTFKVAKDGEYSIILKASGDPAMNERAKFKLTIDGKEVGKETVLTADEAKDYTFTEKLKAGEHKLAVEYTNDVYKENEYDRNFYLHGATVKPAKK
jgi:hypothetical protein